MDFSWIWPWFESQLSTSEIGWLRPPKMLMTSRSRIVAEISSELKNRSGGNLLAPHLQIMGSNPTTYACSFLFHCCTFLIKLFLWWSSSTCRFEFSLLIQSTMNKYCLSLPRFELQCRKRPLYQLCHNHCPNMASKSCKPETCLNHKMQ